MPTCDETHANKIFADLALGIAEMKRPAAGEIFSPVPGRGDGPTDVSDLLSEFTLCVGCDLTFFLPTDITQEALCIPLCVHNSAGYRRLVF